MTSAGPTVLRPEPDGQFQVPRLVPAVVELADRLTDVRALAWSFDHMARSGPHAEPIWDQYLRVIGRTLYTAADEAHALAAAMPACDSVMVETTR